MNYTQLQLAKEASRGLIPMTPEILEHVVDTAEIQQKIKHVIWDWEMQKISCSEAMIIISELIT